MRTKRFAFLILFLCLGLSTFAQQPKLPGKCTAFLPRVLLSPVLKESDIRRFMSSANYGQNETSTSRYWNVYSDRDNNPTYVAPGSQTKYATLEFNEKLRIAEVRNGYALVYKEPKYGEGYPAISKDAVCRGWIHLSKLLLWGSCLSDEHGIHYKALFCTNLSSLDEKTKSVGVGYLNPVDKQTKKRLTQKMDFYYVMKRENNLTLLASQNTLENAIYSKNVLYCWVPAESFVPWNQRSCAEPTWIPDDVEFFAEKKININIFPNKSMQGKSIPITYVAKNQRDTKDINVYRIPEDQLRYPILDDTTKDVYNLSTFCNTGGNTMKTNPVQKIKEEEMKKKFHINIGIVIDGTKSMEPYYPAVKDAIKESVAYFPEKATVKVGVVIYRDYTDGEYVTEYLPLMPPKDNSALVSFLDNGGKYGIKSAANDKTYTEALYKGIDTALDSFKFVDGESNILLVIGDCGNAASDSRCATQEAIAKKLIEKDVVLMGFQVQNKTNINWTSFNDQILSLMGTALQGSYDRLEKGATIRTMPSVGEDGIRNGYNVKATNVNMELFVSGHRYANPNINDGRMSADVLKTHLTKTISDYAERVQKRVDFIVNVDPVDDPGFNELFEVKENAVGGTLRMDRALLREMFGDKITKDDINGLLNFRGYAKKRDVSGRDYFKPVLFISFEELLELIKRLEPVNEAARTYSTNREPYINAMKALVRSFAPDKSDAEMAKMGNSEIMNIVAGLNESARSLKGYSLNEIANTHVVPDNVYQSIIRDFSTKFRKLQFLPRNSRAFVKDFNGAKYYWIPITDLP